MKNFSILLFLIILAFELNGQENIIYGNFAIRDFTVANDSVYFIEKRYIQYYNIQKKDTSTNKYFMGGYGLKVFNDTINRQIISVSNEFEQLVSSLRFYKKSSKKVEDVFYYLNGKCVEALLLPELKNVVLSYTNNKIIVVDYSAKPIFKIIHNIDTDKLSRTMFFKNGFIYYATDSGKIFEYNLNAKNKKEIFNANEKITSLKIFDDFFVCTTISGNILKRNLFSDKTSTIYIKNDFVLNTTQHQNLLIAGTFKGNILIIDIHSMKIIKQIQAHSRSVLKIITDKNKIYSSSIDKTIKAFKFL